MTVKGLVNPDPQMWLLSWTAMGAFLSLLLWGATMPLIAWYQYYRVIRGFGRAESLFTVVGALTVVGAGAYGFAILQGAYAWIAAIVGILSMLTIIMAPWTIPAERRKHNSLNSINEQHKRVR